MLMQGGGSSRGPIEIIDTADLPSTTASSVSFDEREQLMYGGVTRLPRMNYDNNRTARPGWLSQQKMICYQCYTVDLHMSPDCDITITGLAKIVANYEKLYANDKSRVPKTVYNLERQFLGATAQPSTVITDGDSKK